MGDLLAAKYFTTPLFLSQGVGVREGEALVEGGEDHLGQELEGLSHKEELQLQ